MEFVKIESSGIYNSQISHKNINKSNYRPTAMFELELPIENGGISYINKTAMPIEKKRVICSKPNQKRRTKFPFKCYYVHFNIYDESLYNELYSLPDFINIENYSEYERIFKDLYKYSGTYIKRDEIIMQSLILKLIYNLGTEAVKCSRRENTTFNSSINKALKYINENIEDDLSLQKVAEQVSLSPTYFHASFKRAVGKTLREYVEDIRIKKSINLMLTTEMTLAQIAYSSGFSSQSYFSSLFKHKMDCTPRAYLKSLNDRYEI